MEWLIDMWMNASVFLNSGFIIVFFELFQQSHVGNVLSNMESQSCGSNWKGMKKYLFSNGFFKKNIPVIYSNTFQLYYDHVCQKHDSKQCQHKT